MFYSGEDLQRDMKSQAIKDLKRAMGPRSLLRKTAVPRRFVKPAQRDDRQWSSSCICLQIQVEADTASAPDSPRLHPAP